MSSWFINASKHVCNYANRPRILYAVVFFWLAWTGGRFTAPFLKEEVGFNDGQIGFLLACQTGLLAIIGPLGGAIADKDRKPRNMGGWKFYVLASAWVVLQLYSMALHMCFHLLHIL